jgi:hypothetical protein
MQITVELSDDKNKLKSPQYNQLRLAMGSWIHEFLSDRGIVSSVAFDDPLGLKVKIQ